MPGVKDRLDVALSEPELARLEAIAQAHAVELWGDNVACGRPLPLSSSAGVVASYAVPFVIGRRTFPALRPHALDDVRTRFGTVFVTAGPGEQRVFRALHGLYPAFTRLAEARRVVQRELGEHAEIARIYSDGLHQDYLEGAFGERRLLLDMHTLRPVEPHMAFRECPAVPKGYVHKFEPPVLPRPPLAEPVLKTVPSPECMPMVGWTWCATRID